MLSAAAPFKAGGRSGPDYYTDVPAGDIAIKNVSDPDPPAWVSFLLGTHPTTMQRIGQAEAAARASSRDG